MGTIFLFLSIFWFWGEDQCIPNRLPDADEISKADDAIKLLSPLTTQCCLVEGKIIEAHGVSSVEQAKNCVKLWDDDYRTSLRARAAVLSKRPPKIAKRIAAGELWIGMSSSDALLVTGGPTNSSETVTAAGTTNRWTVEYQKKEATLVFNNGVLAQIHR